MCDPSPCGQMEGQVNEEQVLLIRVIKVGGSSAGGAAGRNEMQDTQLANLQNKTGSTIA